mmetsp:Transcript_36242/g.41287  ORF Transcript_36242/g.41287 Transcript_36242/m.41287 type:complete len:444 (+) Transcript_36242:195-1526(+)
MLSFEKNVQEYAILDNKYKILHDLGEGRFAKVKLAESLDDSKLFAIKMMRDKEVNTTKKLESIHREVEILSKLRHKNIIDIYEVSSTGRYMKRDGTTRNVIYYVMRYAECGELYKMIECCERITEKMARTFFHQIIDGIDFCHRNGVSHLDIKSENILVDKSLNIKLGDFGSSNYTRRSDNSRIMLNTDTPVGSDMYNAPEITNKWEWAYCGEMADVFSAGALLFVMMMKGPPFGSSHDSDPYYKRLVNNPEAFWKIFGHETPSPEFKDLFEKMTKRNPGDRIPIPEIRAHAWYNQEIYSREEFPKVMRSRVRSLMEVTDKEIKSKRDQRCGKGQRKSRSPKNSTFSQDVETMKLQMAEIFEDINHQLKNRSPGAKIQKKELHSFGSLLANDEMMAKTKKKRKDTDLAAADCEQMSKSTPRSDEEELESCCFGTESRSRGSNE